MKSIAAIVVFLFNVSAQAELSAHAPLQGTFNFKCGNYQMQLAVHHQHATLRLDDLIIKLPVADDCLATSLAKGAQWCGYNQVFHFRASTNPSQREINLNASFSRNEAEISFINEYSSYQSKPDKCRIFYSN